MAVMVVPMARTVCKEKPVLRLVLKQGHLEKVDLQKVVKAQKVVKEDWHFLGERLTEDLEVTVAKAALVEMGVLQMIMEELEVTAAKADLQKVVKEVKAGTEILLLVITPFLMEVTEVMAVTQVLAVKGDQQTVTEVMAVLEELEAQQTAVLVEKDAMQRLPCSPMLYQKVALVAQVARVALAAQAAQQMEV
jgi:hypothetical protein